MKKSVLLFLILGFAFLFANQLTVKGGDATLLINGQEFNVPEDYNLTLKPGTMVCFVKGSGKVIIDGKKELDHKTKECYQVPVGEDFDIKHFLSTSEDKAVVETAATSASAKDDSIHRGIAHTDDGLQIPGAVTITPSDKEVIIYDENYGPLPVTLSIKKADGTLVQKMVNEESIKTFFRIPVSQLDNNTKIEVTNAFGDKLLEKKVAPLFYSKIEEHGKIFYDQKDHTIVDVLYGTDRETNQKKGNYETFYTGERAELKYGVAQVSIPKTHKLGKMERPKNWWVWQEDEKLDKHVMITKLENIKEKEFLKFLKRKLDFVQENDILIFIHGFNVTFASAIRRTAQISYDLKFKGVPMAYSWPSRGKESEYMYDEASVQYTVPHLVAFFKTIIDGKGNANIHIIGHSMGTRALTNALKEISFVYAGKHVFKNIILAAPDIDKDVFRVGLLPYIKKTTDKITLYASSDDAALKLSDTLHGGERIGQGGDEVFVYDGVDTIDATGIDTSLLGHSYFAQKEILVTDIKEVIIKSLPPTNRKSLIEKLKEKLIYWKFKLDNP